MHFKKTYWFTRKLDNGAYITKNIFIYDGRRSLGTVAAQSGMQGTRKILYYEQ